MKDAWLQDRRMQPRVQLRLGPGETPLEPVLRALGLVETLHVPPQMKRPVFGQHIHAILSTHPPARCLKPPVEQPCNPILLVAAPVTPELPLRHRSISPDSSADSSLRSQRLNTELWAKVGDGVKG
jgi:hypothetical protein